MPCDVTLLMVRGPEIGQLVKQYKDRLIKLAFPKLVNALPVLAFSQQFRIDTGVFSAEELKQKAVVLQRTQLAEDVPHKDVRIAVRFSHLTREQRLRLVLPERLVPSSFEVVGTIAHYNAFPDPEQQRFQNYIGLATLDSAIRTVVLKTQAIQSQFRERPFERIAGVADYVTLVNQQNLKYKIDLRTCYWNSRLDAEHQRVFDALK